MKQIKVKYGVSQEILYTICKTAWDLCSSYLTQFTNLKAYYTADFITASKQAVDDAKALPSTVQTVTDRKAARIALVAGTKQVQANWQLLKIYIVKAYDKSMVDTKLDAAGAAFYNKASVDNWSGVRSLIDAANIFIAANLADLTANQNMPAGFQTTFANDGNDCTELSNNFFGRNIQKQMATGAKIDANNAIYASVIEMLKDGQQIFKDDAAVKKQFTFSRLVSVYRGEGSASLRGLVVNNLNLPVEGVTITSMDQKYAATTNVKGRYRISRIAEGSYTFTVTCPGYTPVEQVINFVAGTASTANFELANAIKKVA